MSNIIETATGYAKRGWMIVPIPYKEKGPKIKGWQNLRVSPETVPFAGLRDGKDNLGLLMGEPSRLVCVDLDCEAARLLAPMFLPATECVHGRGEKPKTHWFYRVENPPKTEKWNIPKHANVETHHSVELLSTGAQVVVGPSVHPSGDIYEDITGEPTEIDGETLRAACLALHRAVMAKLGVSEETEPKAVKREPKTSQFAPNCETDLRTILDSHGATILSTAVTGDGCNGYHVACPNEGLHTTPTKPGDCMVWKGPNGGWQAKCFHASCGIDSWQAFRLAVNPGWQSQSDQLSVVDLSGLVRVTEPDDDDEDDDFEELNEPTGGVIPDELLMPPGLIGDIVRHNLDSAKYPQPEHALAGALALMSLLTGRRVCDAQNTRTNLMIVALGPTRSGKEHPRQINKRILELAGKSALYEEKIASHSALHGFLKQDNTGLLMNDEFGDFLATARQTQGANTQPAQIISAMIKLYSSSSSNYKADRYADNSKQVEINQPHLVLYGTSTGEVFWKHVTPEYLSGGLFGRVMLFENRGYVDPVPLGEISAIPESIYRDVEWWFSCFSHRDLLFWDNPQPVIVPHTPEAKARFAAHELEISQKRKRETPVRAALWSGTAEITAKLGLLFACSRSRNPLQIEIQDVDRAVKLSNWLTRRKVELSGDNVAENQIEQSSKRIFRIVKAAGARGVTKNQLSRKTQWMKKRERDEILTDLVSNRTIFMEQRETDGRTAIAFLATKPRH